MNRLDQPTKHGVAYLVFDANGGWPYVLTDEHQAHERAKTIQGFVASAPLIATYLRHDSPPS